MSVLSSSVRLCLSEDELLQIALKEQAERDLNYRRPSSSRTTKPVSTYVQPLPSNRNHKPPSAAESRNPSSSAAAKSAMPPARARNTKSVDEDEDSDVELLSISSGDEDSSKASNAGRGRARAGGRRES